MNILKGNRLSPTEIFSLDLGPFCLMLCVLLLAFPHKIYALAFPKHIKNNNSASSSNNKTKQKPFAKGTTSLLVSQAHVARQSVIFSPSHSHPVYNQVFPNPLPRASSHYLISVLWRQLPSLDSIHSVLKQRGNSCRDFTDVSFFLTPLCEAQSFPFLL